MQIAKPYAFNEKGGCTNNEDAIFPQKNEAGETSRFFLVCDGMGGHENGEVASASVCESFATFLKDIPPDDFDESVFGGALNFAFDRLDEQDNHSETARKMGTTLAFLHLNNRQAFMAHIGDSRIYHLRKNGSGEVCILYQSSDHSLVNELVKAEVITEKEAVNHPKKNVITRAMQPNLERRCKADIKIVQDIQAGDRFFLCTDGVMESLANDQLCAIVSTNCDDEAMIKAIWTLCEEHSHDNFSAWLVPVTEGTQPRNQEEEKVSDNFLPRFTKSVINNIKLLMIFIIWMSGIIFSTPGINARQQPSTSIEQQIKRNLVGRTVIDPTRICYREKFDIKSIDNILCVEIINSEKIDNELVYHCRLKLKDSTNEYFADVRIVYALNGQAWVFQHMQSKLLEIVSTGKYRQCVRERKDTVGYNFEKWYLYNDCDVTLIVEGKIFVWNSTGMKKEWQYFWLEVPANEKTLLSYDADADFIIERVERP